MLESNTPTVSGDYVWWKLKKNGGFDIHSYYASFLSCLDGSVREDIGDNLRRRGFQIVARYCMCWNSGEIVYHLLIHMRGCISCGVFSLDHLEFLGLA